MAQYKIRLGSILSFDDETEEDLIDTIETLSSKHKLGQYISNLLRISLETPEMMVFKDKNDEIHFSNYMRDLNRLGVTPKRLEKYEELKKDVNKLDQKINDLYDMCLEIKTMAKFGKRLGLDDRVDNILLAKFMVERELKAVKDRIDHVQSKTLESNKPKIKIIDDKAEQYLEYIIETYGDHVKAIQDVNSEQVRYVERVKEVEVSEEIEVREQLEKNEDEEVYEGEEVHDNEVEELEEPEDDDIIDFGNADFGVLKNFFGQ